jgi:predicted phage terminase large subunit-like protein
MLDRLLVRTAVGRVRRLLVAMPPRHGKSTLVSQFFPAWHLGAFPRKRVMLASYAGDFAAGWGKKVRDVIDEFGREAFGISLRKSSAAAHRWEIEGYGGGMTTAGAGGALTGKGADLLIIDDPVKNAEQAASAVWREKTWDWFQSTAYTRLEPGASVVLVQTRWHGDDLAGRLLHEAKFGGEQWTTLSLPAIAEDHDPLGRSLGEALWPERYPLTRLLEIQRTLGAFWWSALYQQRPSPATGGVFQREWFRYWSQQGDVYSLSDSSVRRDACWRFATVDLAVSERERADYTVACMWDVTPAGDLLLLDRIRERLSAPRLVAMIHRLSAKWRPDYLAIEKTGFQLAIVQQLRRDGAAVKPLVARGDKTSRAHAAAVRFEGGQVYFPAGASWLGELEAELLGFPNDPHDDQVDAVSYACLLVSQRHRGAARTRGLFDEGESDA